VKGKIKNPSITDQPSVSREQAAVLFNMGRQTFRRRWDAYFQYHIKHVETRNGLRLLLTDVIRAAFPTANSEIVHMLAYRYVMDSYIHRQKGRNSDDEGSSES